MPSLCAQNKSYNQTRQFSISSYELSESKTERRPNEKKQPAHSKCSAARAQVAKLRARLRQESQSGARHQKQYHLSNEAGSGRAKRIRGERSGFGASEAGPEPFYCAIAVSLCAHVMYAVTAISLYECNCGAPCLTDEILTAVRLRSVAAAFSHQSPLSSFLLFPLCTSLFPVSRSGGLAAMPAVPSALNGYHFKLQTFNEIF